jgi:hypothetical protein
MTLRLNGSTSGYTEIDAPAIAGSNTLRLPTGNGTSGNVLATDGSGNLSWVDGRRMVLETAKAASGTNVDFTGIPSWAKRITVMLNGVSINGTSPITIRVGAGSIQTTGYNAIITSISGATAASGTYTDGFTIIGVTAAASRFGALTLTYLDSNVWTATANIYETANNAGTIAGAVTVTGTLDRVRITTIAGADTFDAGSVNILYEG